jgi:hypothetical protein
MLLPSTLVPGALLGRSLVPQSLLYRRGVSAPVSAMALGVGSASNTDAATYASDSISPSVNVPVYVAVLNVKGASPDTPTLSGCGITWSQVRTQTLSTTRRLTVFEGISGNPSAGAVTADFGVGNNQLACCIVAISCPGAPTASFTVESTGSAGASGTTMTNSLASIVGNNIHLAFIGTRRNSHTAIVPDADFAELIDVNASDGLVLEAQWARGQVDCSPSWASADLACMVSVEVASVG